MEAELVKKLANYLFDRIRLENIINLLFYKHVYRYLFYSIGKGSFVSPFIYPLGLDCVTLGSYSSINRNTRLMAIKSWDGQLFQPSIYIGNNVSVGLGCTLSCVNSIYISDDATLGDNVYVADSHHGFSDVRIGIRDQSLLPGEIYIGKGAWLGYGVFVAGNVVIGEHAVVGANSVVTKSVDPYTVVAGAPAKPISRYNPQTKQWEKVQTEALT
jgi:acetyltransferase-like isoleucine patch superfamily enzyme